jgi:lysophospholipase L1-like esterase
MAFNDARAFPSLYLASSRIDEVHLNAAGANEFARLLALRFLSWKPDEKG